MIRIIISILIIVFPNSGFAYLGPGTGVGVILGSIGILFAIIIALFGLIWFPIKRLLKSKKTKDKEENNSR